MQYNLSNLLKEVQTTPELKNLNSIGDIVSALLPYIFGISGLALLLMIVLSGFQYLTSGGDPKAMEGAQKRLTNAVIGFIIIFAAYWIVQLLGLILGIEIIKTIF